MTVRLIATDLDGTLLRSDHEISARTLEALMAARACGIRVVAATGRGFRSATPLVAPATCIEWAVCSNGAEVRDLVGAATVQSFPISATALVRALAAIDEVVPERGLYWEHLDGVGYDAVYAGLHPLDVRRNDLEPLAGPPLDVPMSKLLIRHPTLDEPALLARLAGVLSPDEVTVSSSGGNLVEVTGAGVHKAAGLAWLCGTWGIEADEVVAFGDNHNDVTMLSWAGHGVAMGRAHEAAIAVADEKTASNDDDGVALVVERILADRT